MNLLNREALFLLIALFIANTNQVFSQLPASVEKEIEQLYSDIFKALEAISTQSEADAVKVLSEIKPELERKAASLAARLNEIGEISEADEEAWNRKMMEKPVFKDMMALLSDQKLMAKIASSQVLQQEYAELMSVMDLEADRGDDRSAQSVSGACSFVIGPGSPLSGSYVVNAMEDQAYAYDDTENDQFVIEIHGDNYIDIILIIEKPVTGKHPFSMEMQVAIDLSTNDGEDYFGLDNHLENSGGYIQIDRLDGIGGIVSGSFQGKFNDYSSGDDRVVDLEGRFSVKRE